MTQAIATHPGLALGGLTDDGVVALSMILNLRPDLALLDVRLTGLDGFELSERLMQHADPCSHTRVVLLSAVIDDSQIARAKSVGAWGCLSKAASRRAICESLLAVAHCAPARRTTPWPVEAERPPVRRTSANSTFAGALSGANGRAA